MNIDPELTKIFKKYGGDASKDLWNCHGSWIAYHKALERIAVQAKITFDMPHVVESNLEKGVIAICVTGNMGDRTEWSIGEAAPNNNKNSYPAAMAEKRGKDRVILKLLGLHGLVYSEEEADDFKQSKPKAQSRDDYTKLEAEYRAINDSASLEKWKKEKKAAIMALPRDWITEFGGGYTERLAILIEQETGGTATVKEKAS